MFGSLVFYMMQNKQRYQGISNLNGYFFKEIMVSILGPIQEMLLTML